MKKRFLSLLLLVLMFSCQKDEIDPITALDVNFTVSFNSDFEKTIYPSFIISLADYTAKTGEEFNLFTVTVTNPQPTSNLKIIIEESDINDQTVIHETLTGDNEEFEFYPKIKWKYNQLGKLNQPGNIDISFICYIDEHEIDSEVLRLSYRGINECIYGIKKNTGDIPLYWMFAAYVNENHPLIDTFLQEALKTGIVSNFSGYQDKEKLLYQVWALWYNLQQKGVKYSSITGTGNSSTKIVSQYVRFFDQVYDNTQANCADGSVFLCSILQKIGIKSFLVLAPGHMYLGFYADASKTNKYLLETTMIGNVDLSKYSNISVKQQYSVDNFNSALAAKINDFNSNLSKINDPNNFEYKVFDIDDLRKRVQPIPRN